MKTDPMPVADRKQVFELIYNAGSYNMTADAAQRQTHRIMAALEKAKILSFSDEKLK